MTPRYVHDGEANHEVEDWELVDGWGTVRCQTCGRLVAQNPDYEPDDEPA